MPQVQMLDENPGFGSQLGRSLGSGLGQGISASITNMLQNKQRQRVLSQILGPQPGEQTGRQSINSPEMEQNFLGALPHLEQALGRELQPQELDQIWKEMSQPQMRQQQVRDPFETAEKLALAGEHDLSKIYTEKAKAERKEKFQRETEKSGRHFEVAKESLKNIATKAENLPQRESALDTMEDAISSGNLGAFTPDNLAELTGIEAFRSPEGALFKTAGKEFFIGNLSRVGSRGLNQWLERQISDMMPKIGRSTEANLVVKEALKSDLDIERKQIELTNQIAEKSEREKGYIPMDLTAQVQKQLSEYAVEKQKELKQKIESIKEKYEPTNKSGQLMYAPDGSLRRVKGPEIKEAKAAGYRVAK